MAGSISGLPAGGQTNFRFDGTAECRPAAVLTNRSGPPGEKRSRPSFGAFLPTLQGREDPSDSAPSAINSTVYVCSLGGWLAMATVRFQTSTRMFNDTLSSDMGKRKGTARQS